MHPFDANWQLERQKPSDAVDSVLLIGQSNMCGRGIVGEVSEIAPHADSADGPFSRTSLQKQKILRQPAEFFSRNLAGGPQA